MSCVCQLSIKNNDDDDDDDDDDGNSITLSWSQTGPRLVVDLSQIC